MGCWNENCAVTNVAIKAGEPVVGMWLVDNSPLPFFWYANYNDYGWYEDIEMCPVMEAQMWEYFRENVIELPNYHAPWDFKKEDKSSCDKGFTKDELDWDRVSDLSHRGRLFFERPRFHGKHGIFGSEDYRSKAIHAKDEVPQWFQDEIDWRSKKDAEYAPGRALTVQHVHIHRMVWDRLVEFRINPPSYSKYEDYDPYNWDLMAYQLEEYVKGRDEAYAKIDEDADDYEQQLWMVEMKLEHIGDSRDFLNWWGYTGSLDSHETWTSIARAFIIEKLKDRTKGYKELLAELTSFMQCRWALRTLSNMGRRIVVPNHIGQKDNRTAAMHYAALVNMAATRPQEYRGISIDEY